MLAPIQEHYLKRELIRSQIGYEVLELSDFKSISSLGKPFIDHGNYRDGFKELPIMTYIFNSQVQSFPFVNSVDPKSFWQSKVQVFLESLAEKDLSSSADRAEDTKRKRIGRKLSNMIALYMASGLQTTTAAEKTARVQPPAEDGVRSIDINKIVVDLYDSHYIHGVDINVVGVRIVSERHGFMYEDHAEFLIKAQLQGAPPVHVARRYSDFKKLQTRLGKEFPGKMLASLPSRNKSATVTGDEGNVDAISEASYESDPEFENASRPNPIKKLFHGSKKSSGATQSFPREKQRITFRSYLRSLLQNTQVARSQTLLEFLFRDKLQLTAGELKDIDCRRKLDIKRIEDQVEFYKIATERARQLEVHMTEFKHDIMQPDGLRRLFAEIREKESVDQLSPKFQKFIQWAGIEFGGTLYNMFVADDSSPEFFSQVSRIHRLVPYTLLRTVLRFSNPMAIMKGVIDLFLAQPLGRRSLLQNILRMVLADDIKVQEKAIEVLMKKTDNPAIASTLNAYIDSTASVKEEIRRDAAERDVDILVAVFGSPMISHIPPELALEIESWYSEWNKAVEGESKVNTDYVDNYSALTELFRLMVRKRDKDQMQNLWDEASTMGLVKELLTIFYGPLVDVFRSAKVHEAVSDFEKFMSDLVQVVHRAEMNALAADPNQMVQEFFELCDRHVPALFKFVHQIYVNDNGLFEEIMAWISGIMEFLRHGNDKRIDLNEVLRKGLADGKIDGDKVIQEMDATAEWINARRAWREEMQSNKKPAANEQAIKQWQDSVPTQGIDSSVFGLDQGDVEDYEDEDDSLSEDSEDYENADSYDKLTVLEVERKRRARLLKKLEQQSRAPKRPEITETLKLRPYFQASLSEVLRPQQTT